MHESLTPNRYDELSLLSHFLSLAESVAFGIAAPLAGD